MVEFWTDHFNIYVAKGDCWFLKVVDDREVVRKHALGNFRDLLLASAHSPAMLVYLDNQANEKAAPNENYGREVMELHTLGVGSGYTQEDVMQLARCLTGWGVKRNFWRGQFQFDPDQHAGGTKKVLGQVIQPGGRRRGRRGAGAAGLAPGDSSAPRRPTGGAVRCGSSAGCRPGYWLRQPPRPSLILVARSRLCSRRSCWITWPGPNSRCPQSSSGLRILCHRL